MGVWGGSVRGERARFGCRRHTERHEQTQPDTDMVHRDSPHRETLSDTHRHRQSQAVKMSHKGSAQKCPTMATSDWLPSERHPHTQTDTDRHMPCSFEARFAADDFNVGGVRVAPNKEHLLLQKEGGGVVVVVKEEEEDEEEEEEEEEEFTCVCLFERLSLRVAPHIMRLLLHPPYNALAPATPA